MQSFMFLAIGIGALLVALALTLLLLRVNRTLFVLEAMVLTMTEEMRQTLPEVRQSLDNLNEFTGGVNVALQHAGDGLGRANTRLRRTLRERGRDAAAAWYGVLVAGKTLSEAYAQEDLQQQGIDVSKARQTVSKEDEGHGQG